MSENMSENMSWENMLKNMLWENMSKNMLWENMSENTLWENVSKICCGKMCQKYVVEYVKNISWENVSKIYCGKTTCPSLPSTAGPRTTDSAGWQDWEMSMN
jgi:hypothetical protein